MNQPRGKLRSNQPVVKGFFLDIPTKDREHYFDETSTVVENSDVRQPLTISDSNQIQPSTLSFTPTTSTVKHFAFQSIGINSIRSNGRSQHNLISSSGLDGFFLDIPTESREQYFDEISTAKENDDVKQRLTFSNSTQLQPSTLSITPITPTVSTTQKSILTPPRLRQGSLKFLKPRSNIKYRT